MPRLDKTGPRGQGPRTGRGLGYCPPGFGGFGRGWGRGFGFGQGWGFPYWRYSQEPTAKEEKEMLIEESKALKEDIKEIEKRLEELKNKK